MAKANLGTKRICPTTGRKFYDLGKDPVVSPYTGEIVPIVVAVTRARPGEAARAAAAAREQEAEKVEPVEAELISLEDADAEAQGKKVPAADDVDAIEDVDTGDEAIDDGDEDETFIEEAEEEDTDVTEIIGGDIEKEEES